MSKLKLFMVLMGGKPAGRHTEQHDMFFGIAEDLKDLYPSMQAFWPEIANNFHIDAWRAVTRVDEFSINIGHKTSGTPGPSKLFFINLGGYRAGEFEELHYKLLIVAVDKKSAIAEAKKRAFFQHTGEYDQPHIDDKYGVDVDDLFELPDVLPDSMRMNYHISIDPVPADTAPDPINLGYLPVTG